MKVKQSAFTYQIEKVEAKWSTSRRRERIQRYVRAEVILPGGNRDVILKRKNDKHKYSR